MSIKKTVFLVALTGIICSSCSSDNDPVLPKGDYENGLLITNEGAFTGGTGTVNFISNDYTTEESKIYNKVNDGDIGTILQSIGFTSEFVFLIANVGNKITIADRYTMEKITEITVDLNNPRYMAFANGKGFVTNWGDGFDTADDYVAVVDLLTNTITAKIPVIEGPEQIIANGNTLYISHKGGYGSGNSVTVINAVTNAVEQNIFVGETPDELAIDNSGNLLVSCEGKALAPWNPIEILGGLVKVNTATNEVSATLNYDSGFHPNKMVLSASTIYFSTDSGIYKMAESSSTIPSSEIISTPVYGLSVNENKIYVTDAKDFASNGSLKIFDATTNLELNEFIVGLIPLNIYFN
jgi:YVTN family beta-propeller protein